MPSTPYTISGVIKNSSSTAVAGVAVQAKNLNTGEYLKNTALAITNSGGEYTIDLANFPAATPYNNGDLIRIIAYKPEQFAATNTVVDTSVGTLEKDLTLTDLTYTKPTEVAGLLGSSIGFTLTTTPNVVDICQLIYNAEDYIDFRTGHAWRSTTITDEEHTLATTDYFFGTGRAIFLKHRAVKTFASPDKLEVFDGSSYVNWRTDKTEGRTKDFWFDYDQGIVFINQMAALVGRTNDIRVTYRFGEDTVSSDINMAARMWVAKQVLMGDDRSVLLPSGESSNLSYAQKIEAWDRIVERVLASRREIRVAVAKHMVNY